MGIFRETLIHIFSELLTKEALFPSKNPYSLLVEICKKIGRPKNMYNLNIPNNICSDYWNQFNVLDEYSTGL